MPIQVPLLNGGGVPLRQTGISVPRTAQLQAGNTGLGKAVSQIGADLGQLAEREQRANDARQMLEFESAMRSAEEQQQIYQQQTQEQDSWLPNWQTQEQALQKSLEKMKLSPDARVTLQSTLGRYVDNKRMSIRDQAVNQSEQRFKTGLNTRLMQAKTPEEVDTIISLVPPTLMLPEEKEGVRVRAVEKVKGDQLASLGAQESELIRLGNQGDANAWIELKGIYNKKKELGEIDQRTHELKIKQADSGETQALIQSRITGADGLPIDLERARTLIEKSDLTPEVKANLEVEVSRARSRYANQDLIAFADRMAKGEAIDGNDFTSPYMGEAELAETRAKINEAVPVTPEQEARFYLDTMTAIDDFDPKKAKERDPAEVVKMAKAALGIRKSPPHLRNLLAETMQAKMSNNQGKGIVADGEKRARSMLLEIVKGKEAEFFQGVGAEKKIKTGKESDWMKFQQRVFNLESEVSNRIKDVKDTQKIDQIVSDVLGADYTSVKKSAYMPAPQSGFGPMNRLEGRIDGIDPILFPSFDTFQQ